MSDRVPFESLPRSWMLLIHEQQNDYLSVATNFVCGFPLAEERKKRKTFFSHTAGSLGTGLRGGVSGHMACKVSVFVLPSAIA